MGIKVYSVFFEPTALQCFVSSNDAPEIIPGEFVPTMVTLSALLPINPTLAQISATVLSYIAP